MITDPWFYVVAIPAVLLVGMSKGGFGGTLSMLGVPLMALVISPIKAAAILLPILIVMDMVGVASYRNVFDRRSITIMLPAAVVGIGVGWATARFFDEQLVRLVIGASALIFAIDFWRKPAEVRQTAQPHNAPKGVFWGSLTGFTSFLAHAGAPPYQMYMLPLRLEPLVFAGTSVVFFTTVNLIKTVPYFFLGQFSGENLMTSAVLLPLAPLATLAGVWLVKRVPKGPFYTFTYACFFIASLKLIWDGVSGLL